MSYDYLELINGLEGLIDTKLSQIFDDQRNDLQSEIESIIADSMMDHEAFLLDYINNSKRSENIEQSLVQLSDQRIIVQKEISFGDVAVITLLVFIAASMAGKQLYQKLKDIL